MNLYTTLDDAKTAVGNSGVYEWDWGHEKLTNSEVLDELINFIYRNNLPIRDAEENEIDETLRRFIKEILNQNPSDYSL